MKVLIIYDSAFGNTAHIVQAMVAAASKAHDVRFSLAEHTTFAAVHTADVIVFGSPTQGGRPTQRLQAFINRLPAASLTGKRVAAFDTRFAYVGHGPILAVLMRVIGYAAPRIAVSLHAKGGTLVGRPEGFIVISKEGPLRSGELERAAAWIEGIVAMASTPLSPAAP